MPNDLAAALAALQARVAALEPDAPAAPFPGFGTIHATFGRVGRELEKLTPSVLRDAKFDLGSPFRDPQDAPLLTPGAQRLLTEPNAGGSSRLSEAFAFEILARCEGATLLKTESEIQYDAAAPPADFLVAIDGRRVGVNVVRAFSWPFGTPYTLTAATTVLSSRLGAIVHGSRNVAATDAWVKQILFVMAVDQQAADTLVLAYRLRVEHAIKADTIVYVVVTDGNDANLYTTIS